MNEDELIALFNQVWEKYLQLAIEKAQTCDFNFVKTKLSQQSLNFVDNSQEHRTFRLKELNLEFIVQLKQLSSDQYELTQLWFLKSTDKYPNCILVCFDTVDEKKEFDNIAEQLNWKPQTLAKQLLLDFLNKFKR